MENRRIVLLAVIGMICYLLYQNWRKDYEQPAASPEAAAAATAAVADSSGATAGGGRIQVQTDTFDAEISLDGGDLRRVELRDYPLRKDRPDIKLALLDDRDGRWSILQSGLAGPQRTYSQPSTPFHAAQQRYVLAPGSDTLEVPLDYDDPSGLKIRKVYRFHRGSYKLDLEQDLSNGQDHDIQVSPYVRWSRKPEPSKDKPPFSPSGFEGFGVYQQKEGEQTYKFEKLAYKDVTKHPFSIEQTGGWLVVLQHYFVAGIIPPAQEKLSLSVKPTPSIPGAFLGQYVGAMQPVAAGASVRFDTKLYIGPTLHDVMDTVAPGFQYTEDYGLLTWLAKPLFWVMKLYHSWTGNWGVAIILLTLTVRALFFPLTAAQFRSSAKMRQFAPRMKELRERYADNREQLNKAMMDLYKKEGFNPLAGCWPLLIQFPVFIAMYWVVSQSVELRQAPFALWINDLTAADHYFVLPLLYGATMWLMQKISGQTATMDPTQARIMNIMPIVMTGMFAFFPSGLVLYWVVSNSLSVAQQWVILRRIQGGQAGK